MDNMTTLKVGDVYTRVVGRVEGCFADHPDVFELVANYASPKPAEIDHYREEKPFEIRFCVLNGVLFFLFRAEGEPWQDAPFSPHLATNKDYEEIEDGMGYSLILMLTDAPRGTIKAMRMIGLGTKFSRKLRSEIMGLLEKPFDVDQHDKAVASIYTRYSTKDLLKFTTAECRYKVG